MERRGNESYDNSKLDYWFLELSDADLKINSVVF